MIGNAQLFPLTQGKLYQMSKIHSYQVTENKNQQTLQLSLHYFFNSHFPSFTINSNEYFLSYLNFCLFYCFRQGKEQTGKNLYPCFYIFLHQRSLFKHICCSTNWVMKNQGFAEAQITFLFRQVFFSSIPCCNRSMILACSYFFKKLIKLKKILVKIFIINNNRQCFCYEVKKSLEIYVVLSIIIVNWLYLRRYCFYSSITFTYNTTASSKNNRILLSFNLSQFLTLH